jgi:methionine synthase II (cobalamin-independent)
VIKIVTPKDVEELEQKRKEEKYDWLVEYINKALINNNKTVFIDTSIYYGFFNYLLDGDYLERVIEEYKQHWDVTQEFINGHTLLHFKEKIHENTESS